MNGVGQVDGAPSKRVRYEEVGGGGGGEQDYDLITEEDEERLREERRKRRKAILERHQGTEGGSAVDSACDGETRTRDAASPMQKIADATVEQSFALLKSTSAVQQASNEQGMSAADYTSAVDRELDQERERKLLHAQKEPERGGGNGGEADDSSEYEYVEVSDDEEEVDDMFALSDEVKEKKRKMVKRKKVREEPAQTDEITEATSSAAGLHDNWDDAEGYYRVVLGERIGEAGRYQVFATLGQGMFSAVVRARDTQQGDGEVAIKIIRSQESMYKAGLKEISILQRLASFDPDDKKHIIRLLGHFEHRNHLCMVFESLSMNLREVVKRFGRDVGLNLRAVRAYAHQMFLALGVMRRADVMHADLKPDNILVSESKAVLKICDLGSASSVSEMEITPYLVSRFYRAPEIILGLPYDCALDMWSIGCTLFELYTGRILFPGKSNNHMLLLMQELRGKFTTKQIRKSRFAGLHFDDQNAFVSRERDRTTGSDVLRKVVSFNPVTAKTDIRSRLLTEQTLKGMSPADVRLTNSFVDLLGRTLELDPARRITPNQALQHPFFS